jgi:Protein of unknown function (DUF4038)/Putative collagen-binding domain of a collagenase
MPSLSVSANRRYLVDEHGAPFFWLADTAWELFHRLDRGDAAAYLADRAAKGFTVIQAVVLAEFAGLSEPNAYGHLPLAGNDPGRPDEGYFQDVDWVVKRANALGLSIGMLPTWGDKWNKKWGMGPEIFDAGNARRYGEFLGARYQAARLVWILGGDRPIENDGHRALIRAMAEGLKAGDGGAHLMTYHPSGGSSSSQWLHDEPWLDFNMLQSGHRHDRDCYAMISRDYAREPAKPCLDGEAGYEDHPNDFKPENGWLDEWDVRKELWWALLAGACGHTYGCHDIWQFLSPARAAVTYARTPWKQALQLPGAAQVRHARHLLESRPYLTRIPDQGLLVSPAGVVGEHCQAARAEDGGYAIIYSASGRPLSVDLGRLSGEQLRASWFDPRTGAATIIEVCARSGQRTFGPPSAGAACDWVLVLDDLARGFPL